jgi:dCMP deaminase
LFVGSREKQLEIDWTYIRMAEVLSERSKCAKLRVGAVVCVDDRIISTGYNGSPAGFKNCRDVFGEDLSGHSDWSADFEIHAEMNALMFAAKNGIATDGSTVYCTHIPCHNCLKHIAQAGVTRVVYLNDHYNVKYTDQTRELIATAGLTVEKLEKQDKDGEQQQQQ